MKVFLSPSNQPNNKCVLGGHSEKDHCEEIAGKLKRILIAKGFECRIASPGTLTQKVNESKSWGADIYIPMHTNATANGTARGTRFGYYPGRSDSKAACEIFKKRWSQLYPNPERVKVTTYDFSEAKNPKCPSVYCEMVFHDNLDDATWFHQNMDACAEQLSLCVADFFGVNPAPVPVPVPPNPDPIPDPKPPVKNEPIVKIKIMRDENAYYLQKPIGTIVEIPMEEYLLGVVPAEMGNPHIEAAKAQAIAARVYAMKFDGAVMNDGSPHQAWRYARSIDKAYINAHEGVKATSGQILTYKGPPINGAYYSDSNGGTCLKITDVWSKDDPSKDEPYLLHRSDPWTAATGKPKNGHGIGLSQVGTEYAAQHGVSHEDILSFYYPGTEITNDYGKEDTMNLTGKLAKVNTKYDVGLSLWNSPNKNKKLIAVAKGEIVKVIKDDNSGWVLAEYRGVQGDADKRYLEYAGEIPVNPPVVPDIPLVVDYSDLSASLDKIIEAVEEIKKAYNL